MKIKETVIDGVYIIENFKSEDIRGDFVKVFSESFFKENKINTQIKEVYYSTSRKRRNKRYALSNPAI